MMGPHRGRWLLLIVGVILSLASLAVVLRAARAQTSLLPSDDGYVDRNRPGDSLDEETLFVAYSALMGEFEASHAAYLQFDVSSSGPVTYSTVSLYVVENLVDAGSLALGLYLVDDGWDESTLSFDSTPAVGSLLQVVTVTAATEGQIIFGNPGAAHSVGLAVEQERTGDGLVSFALLPMSVTDATLVGVLQFEDREGTFDGVNGNEPRLELSGATSNVIYLPLTVRQVR